MIKGTLYHLDHHKGHLGVKSGVYETSLIGMSDAFVNRWKGWNFANS